MNSRVLTEFLLMAMITRRALPFEGEDYSESSVPTSSSVQSTPSLSSSQSGSTALPSSLSNPGPTLLSISCSSIMLISTVGSTLNATSPAGGLQKNPNAVICTFIRKSNRLTCKKGSSSETCTTVPPAEKRDDRYGGPTPLGEYLIGKRYTNKNIDWYNLYPKKEDSSGYYGYTQCTRKGRSAMGLHPGTVSLGCVTVNAPTYNNDPCWQRIRKVIDSGNMSYRGSGYSGFLYVK